MTMRSIGLGCPLKVWVVAALVGIFIMLILLFSGSTWLSAIFIGIVATGVIGLLLSWRYCHPGERLRAAPATEPVDPLQHISGAAEPAPKARDAAKPGAATPNANASTAAPTPVLAPAPTPAPALADVSRGGELRPEALRRPRDGGADDLKKIKGIGPKLETMLNELGIYHFNQVAGWNADEVAWVDQNLKGFKGRVTRDGWIAQARRLAAGQETEFSSKMDKGGVY